MPTRIGARYFTGLPIQLTFSFTTNKTKTVDPGFCTSKRETYLALLGVKRPSCIKSMSDLGCSDIGIAYLPNCFFQAAYRCDVALEVQTEEPGTVLEKG